MTQPAKHSGDIMIDGRIEALIAIGAALASNCIPCYENLYEKAIGCGLTVEQIKRASDIAGQVKKGAHTAISNCMNELLGYKEIAESPCMQTATGSCCSS